MTCPEGGLAPAVINYVDPGNPFIPINTWIFQFPLFLFKVYNISCLKSSMYEM